MIVIMRTGATEEQVEAVRQHVAGLNLNTIINRGVERTVVAVVGATHPEQRDGLLRLAGVLDVVPISRPYKRASREAKHQNTVVRVGDVEVGGPEPTVMAGPCVIESEEQVVSTARAVKEAGARVLRGGAFKPRTSPYSFRGMGEEGLRLLRLASQETGLPVVTEVMGVRDIDLVARYADILQVGARNAQNYFLLDEVGRVDKPVLLKRGFAGTYEDWLLAAEYVMAAGNQDVILCERGIRTFETYTRNTLDIAAIPVIHHLSHLPVIADPSHGTGRWQLVIPMAIAAIAAGADGLLVEVHPDPDKALSDGAQSLTPDNFRRMMDGVRAVAEVGRLNRNAVSRLGVR
ncbi:MAG: 3-deoxy-7-phosphoheptulonate synthase [Gemmatimonadetes bacterium]|nr:3-deoxy-7-phosphoheptulonate synthase [Gemmatimonadota bacterium]